MKRKYIKSILIKYLIFYNDLRKECSSCFTICFLHPVPTSYTALFGQKLQ